MPQLGSSSSSSRRSYRSQRSRRCGSLTLMNADDDGVCRAGEMQSCRDGDDSGHLECFCVLRYQFVWHLTWQRGSVNSSPCVFHFVAQTFYLWLETETEMELEMGSRHAT